jgi:hypothetical protein
VSPQQIADKWTLNECKVGSKALRDADRREGILHRPRPAMPPERASRYFLNAIPIEIAQELTGNPVGAK